VAPKSTPLSVCGHSSAAPAVWTGRGERAGVPGRLPQAWEGLLGGPASFRSLHTIPAQTHGLGHRRVPGAMPAHGPYSTGEKLTLTAARSWPPLHHLHPCSSRAEVSRRGTSVAPVISNAQKIEARSICNIITIISGFLWRRMPLTKSP